MRLDLRGICKTYHMAGELEVPALRGVDLVISSGEFVALVGPSGCGKTTLLSILGLLSRPSRGTYLLDGCDVAALDRNEQARYRAERLGFIFQAYNLLPREKAWRNAMLPLTFRRCHAGERKTRALRALADVGLAKRAGHVPSQMSGGEQQRVAIARALIHSPTLILADEPTGNLDSRTGAEILELIRRLTRARGATVVMATHNSAVADCADRVVAMRDGRIEDGG